MKGRFFPGAAVIGIFLFGFAAVSQAGGWMHRSEGSGEEERKAVERTEDPAVRDSSSWQYFEAVETGNFPPAADSGHSTAREVAPILWDQPNAKPEVGGLEFRDVDVGP